MASLIEHFRRELGHTAAETGGARGVPDVLLAQPEISQLCVPRLVQHHVVRLQVALYHVLQVQMFNCQHDFSDVKLGCVFVEFLEFMQYLT